MADNKLPMTPSDEFFEAHVDRIEAGRIWDEAGQRAALHRMWSAAAAELSSRSPLQPTIEIDAYIGEWLLFQIKEITSGEMPDEIHQLQLKTHDRRCNNSVLVEAKRIAVTYLQAVEVRDVCDDAPNKTIRVRFGVDDQTVRDWKNKDFPESLWPHFYAQVSLEERRSRLIRALSTLGKIYRASRRHS